MAEHAENRSPGGGRALSGWAVVMALALTALALLGFLWIREQRCAARERPAGRELWLRLDLNSAGADELQLIPGVGVSRAERIVEARRTRGGFRRLEELDEPGLLGPGAAGRLASYFQPLPGDRP